MKKGQFAILIAVIILGLGGIFGYVKYRLDNDKKPEENQQQNDTKQNDKTSEREEEKNSNDKNELSVRTYRFFGYESSPDMYTTLKLYSNGKYDFYINECEGVGKYSGTYTESDTAITLTGSKNKVITKKYDGNVLEFDGFADSCGYSGESFALESCILENCLSSYIQSDF